MRADTDALETSCNDTRYTGQADGHYESFFVRANHPTRPLAFWIRYTIFSPKGAPEKAVGELWAILFDGERNSHVAAKSETPLSNCAFAAHGLSARISAAELSDGRATGAITQGAARISWDLHFGAGGPPLFLLPRNLYEKRFPAAKSLVSRPLAKFDGKIVAGDEAIDIAGWTGSQNHNWGRRHTDLYAWGQVAGFDGRPDTFLEVATARLKLGPFWTPPITPLVLRHDGREHSFTGLRRAMRARGGFRCFEWDFATGDDKVEVRGRIAARREAFVGLAYANPPGGAKHCLNSKIATCTLHVRDRASGKTEPLTAQNRAAFEILTDARDHGVAIVA